MFIPFKPHANSHVGLTLNSASEIFNTPAESTEHYGFNAELSCDRVSRAYGGVSTLGSNLA